MENIIVNDRPGSVRVHQWTVCLSWFISLVGLASHAQALSSVTLAWDPSAGSGVAGYRLHYGVVSGSYSSVTDVGNTTTATIAGLSEGNTYFIVVTAYSGSGLESAASNEVAFVPGLKKVEDKDFNGDGYADLIWEESTTGQRLIWLMNKGVPTTSVDLPTVDPSWHIAGVGDFLGNGQTDLVWERTDGDHLGLASSGGNGGRGAPRPVRRRKEPLPLFPSLTSV
jgi:Fibronectin type III domain/FG-GAP-like repeat